MDAGVVATGAGVPVSQEANIYSVVLTESLGKVGFEMLLLKGEMRRPEQIENDLRRVLEWVERGGLLHSDEGDGGA